jgi:hypothetical protein
VREEQGGDRVAGAVDGHLETRRAHPPVPAALGGEQVDGVVRGVVADQGGGEDDTRSECLHGGDGVLHRLQ